MYGIPEYRLSKKLVTDVIEDLLEMGIHVKYNTLLSKDDSMLKNEENNLRIKNRNEEGNYKLSEDSINDKISDKKIITIDSIFAAGYEAIFLGIGSEISNLLSIEGIKKQGIHGANEFLKEERHCKGRKIIVIGGGNVAMDAARVAKREGADVTVVYRRLKENMPASHDEIEAAEKEGVKFIFKTNVIKIIGDKKVTHVECDTGLIIETDDIVMAIGSTPNRNYIDERLKFTEQGLIAIDENYETSLPNVFAGGDLVQKKATVCMAIKNGKEAAIAINNKIEKTK